MFNLSITPDLLAYLLAGLTAVAFDWFPGLSGWYDTLSELKKRQLMGAVLVAILVVIYGGVCAKIFLTQFSCDQTGIVTLVEIFMVATGINQGIHLLTKPASGS